MKRIYRTFAILPLAAVVATAQEGVTIERSQVDALKRDMELLQDNLKQAKVLQIGGAVMGPTVKNAPYSAVEVTESTQTLADGTRIHNESQTNVYRDSEGRVRRETPDQVTIWDPVAGTSYTLNPKTQTARKLPLGSAYTMVANGNQPNLFVFRQIGPGAETKLPARVTARPGPRSAFSPKTESLGKQTIEGVPSEGTRVSDTIEAGAIGNDRPLQIVSENWFSSDLQALVKSVHTDPRTGEEIFRLTNVSRVEPPSTLFEVPAEYQVIERK